MCVKCHQSRTAERKIGFNSSRLGFQTWYPAVTHTLSAHSSSWLQNTHLHTRNCTKKWQHTHTHTCARLGRKRACAYLMYSTVCVSVFTHVKVAARDLSAGKLHAGTMQGRCVYLCVVLLCVFSAFGLYYIYVCAHAHWLWLSLILSSKWLSKVWNPWTHCHSQFFYLLDYSRTNEGTFLIFHYLWVPKNEGECIKIAFVKPLELKLKVLPSRIMSVSFQSQVSWCTESKNLCGTNCILACNLHVCERVHMGLCAY